MIPALPTSSEAQSRLRSWLRRLDIEFSRDSYNRQYHFEMVVKRGEVRQGRLEWSLPPDFQTDMVTATYKTGGQATHRILYKRCEAPTEMIAWKPEVFETVSGENLTPRLLAAYYRHSGDFHANLSDTDLAKYSPTMLSTLFSEANINDYINEGLSRGFVLQGDRFL